jgi:membrane-associated phospholipid phosphatase
MIDQTKQKWFHVFLTVWILMICASVVLVHQHHLFDIFTGLILAYLAIKTVYRRFVPRIFEELK